MVRYHWLYADQPDDPRHLAVQAETRGVSVEVYIQELLEESLRPKPSVAPVKDSATAK